MKRELSHDDAFALLDALAMDSLDGSERDAVASHAARCETCGPELASLRETFAQLAFTALPAVAMDAGARERIHSRLMDRAASEASARGVGPLRVEPPSSSLPSPTPMSMTQQRQVISSLAWRRSEWIAAAASVLLVVSVGLLAATLRDRQTVKDALQAELARSAGTRTSNDSLRSLVASRDSMITGLIGRDVAVMSLTSAGSKAPFARMFWDTARNTWTLAAHNMPELKSGRTYQLWLVTKTAKISAGTFAPTNGEAVVRATYPLARDSLEAIAVTEEPAGGVPQPTGAIVIAGK
jgi:anti-sigma-K factor RskA